MENKNENIEVGPAVPGDEAGIAAVYKDTWLATYPNAAAGITKNDVLSMAKNFDSVESLKNWKEKISGSRSKQNYVCVAKVSGRIVAFCCGKKFEEYNQLSAIYIAPGYQRQGIGRQLIADVFEWLGKNKKIIVAPVAYNLPAIGFYKRIGFAVVEGKSSSRQLPSGKIMPLIEMEINFNN